MKHLFPQTALIGIIFLLFILIAPLSGPAGAYSFPPEKSAEGMVVTSSPLADEVGRQVLQSGGNAMDAAVAVSYVLAVVFPESGNLGGGGFAVIHTAAGENTALDFREMAPGHANHRMFQDSAGSIQPFASQDGYLASAVPGTVAGMNALLERYGSRKLADLMDPAIQYARKGFIVDDRMARVWAQHASRLAKSPAAQKYFLKRDGTPYREGDLFTQEDLGKTLHKIASDGPQDFYQGDIAGLIADDMSANGGIITRDDLAKYRPVWRDPVIGTYRGCQIVSMPPPSSGGIPIIQILNIMEKEDLADHGHNSSPAIHLMTEAMRYTYADRAELMGDPDYIKIPVKGLTSKAYADEIYNKIPADRAVPSRQIRYGMPELYESNNTTHFSILDKWGNAVSVTYTLNNDFGSAVAVSGAGFLLNSAMDDFTIQEGAQNAYGYVGGTTNTIWPRKRPISPMAPTIVLKNGVPLLVLGSSGGARIISSVVQVIANVVDFGMNIQEAVDAPRIHMQWVPDEIRLEKNGLPQDVVNNLNKMGYQMVAKQPIGEVNAIFYDNQNKTMYGAHDPRGR